MAHDARAVANYFIDKAKESSKPITHLALQKLIYFAHGWTLGLEGKNLIRDAVEAWRLGPVIRTIWDAFKQYGSKPIKTYAMEFDPSVLDMVRVSSSFSSNEIAILDRVWELYGKLEPFQLSDLTHRSDTPWATTRAKDDTVIPNDMIKRHFEGLRGTARA